MDFPLQGGSKRLLVLAGACLLSGLLIFQALVLWLANRRVQSGRLEIMQRGAELLPGNAESWDRVGRFQQLDFANPDSRAAIQNYLKAVHYDPHSSFYWIDLASAYEDVGNMAAARSAFDNAERAYPISALVSWNYGNFLVRLGDYDGGYRKIQNAGRVDPALLPLAISRTWRATGSVDDLLNKALPPDRQAYVQALNFFTSLGRTDACLQVWQKLMALGQPLPVADTLPFQDTLINAGAAGEEVTVWRQSIAAAGIGDQNRASSSLIWNGDFAHDFVNGGLDWRWTSSSNVSASFDSAGPSHRGRSIRLDFGGGANTFLNEPAQYVPVEPGRRYHFHAWLRTEQITTESGMQISITDPNHNGAVDFASDNFTGSHEWTPIDADVAAGPQTHFFLVRLLRAPSRLFDNKISGTVWLSGVSLVPDNPGQRSLP